MLNKNIYSCVEENIHLLNRITKLLKYIKPCWLDMRILTRTIFISIIFVFIMIIEKEVISKYNVLKILSFVYRWCGIFNFDSKLNMKLKSFRKRIKTIFKIRFERKSTKYIYYIYNSLNRTRCAAAVREFRPLTSNWRCERSDRRILLKSEPLGSYQKEISNEY